MRRMSKPRTNKEGFEAVTKKVHKALLAAVLGISRQAIGKWTDEVPEAYVLRVSVITGIPAEDILPELVAETRKRAKAMLVDE